MKRAPYQAACHCDASSTRDTVNRDTGRSAISRVTRAGRVAVAGCLVRCALSFSFLCFSGWLAASSDY